MGTGKTLLLTYLTHLWDSFGYRVYSTYNLYYLDYVPFNNLAQLGDLKEDKAFLAADEGWLMADSRRSMSLQNVVLSAGALQSRKKHLSMAISAQDYMQLEVRIRRVVDYIMYPSIIKRVNDSSKGAPMLLSVDIYDGFHNFLKTINVPMIFCGIDIPYAYDTDEIVKNFANNEYQNRINLIKKYWNCDEKKKNDLTDKMYMGEQSINNDVKITVCRNLASTIIHNKNIYDSPQEYIIDLEKEQEELRQEAISFVNGGN